MHQLILMYFLLICGTITATSIKCNRYKLINGRVRMKPTSKFARFYCNKGYMIIGTKYSGCINGYFDQNPPICVKNEPNCKKIQALNNGLVIPEANNVVVHFFCKPEYVLIGPNVTICDGDNWIFQLPFCSLNGTEPETSCDFESGLCGWSHDLNHNFDWMRTNSETPSPLTGPQFDHTKGYLKNGHYMYVESTNRKVNDSSRLISPVYGKMAQICVRFYYHMFGKHMGSLNVYLKQENERFDRLKPRFRLDGNQGDFWHLGQFSVENGTEAPFQVIFEGVRGASYLSDIAIDDVSIEEDLCPEETVTTEYSTETSEIPDLDSCWNRCGENVTNFEYITTCSCDENCFDLNLCCADFIQYCVLGTSVDYEDVDMTTMVMSSDTDLSTEFTTIPAFSEISTTIPAVSATKQPVNSAETTVQQVNLKIFTKPTMIPKKPAVITPSTTKTKPTPPTIPTTPKKKPTIATTPKKKPTIPTRPTTIKTTTLTPKTTPKTLPTTLKTLPTTLKTSPTSNLQDLPLLTDKTSPQTPQIETDFLTVTTQPDVQYLQHLQQNTKTAIKSNNLFIYLGVFISVAFVTVLAVFLAVLAKRNDLNYKKFTTSRNTDSMSDVRFLASDEVLDFTWKRAEDL